MLEWIGSAAIAYAGFVLFLLGMCRDAARGDRERVRVTRTIGEGSARRRTRAA